MIDFVTKKISMGSITEFLMFLLNSFFKFPQVEGFIPRLLGLISLFTKRYKKKGQAQGLPW